MISTVAERQPRYHQSILKYQQTLHVIKIPSLSPSLTEKSPLSHSYKAKPLQFFKSTWGNKGKDLNTGTEL
jgi:hypothetical protein